MTRLTLAVLAAMLAFAPAQAAQEDQLRIIDKDTSYKVKTADGEEVTITRTMTKCAKNKGWLQPLIPAKGINPVVELEVLAALNDKDFVVADMREVDWHLQGTIPAPSTSPTRKSPAASVNSAAKRPKASGIARMPRKFSASAMVQSVRKAPRVCAP